MFILHEFGSKKKKPNFDSFFLYVIRVKSHFNTPDRPPLCSFDPRKDFVFPKVRFRFLVTIFFVLFDFSKKNV